MASHLLDELQHGPVYAEGSGAPLSLLVTGILLAVIGLILRALPRAS